jgi:glyceraldehyde 3-phosphate dehydrogenase
MRTRYAINGLGRIGRALVRVAADRPGLELVAVNDVAAPQTLARLLARDSLYGRFRLPVVAAEGSLSIGDRAVRVSAAPSPPEIPWEEQRVAVVVEASGRFSSRAAAAGHLRGGVERVVLSTNADDADVTLCLGVNDGALDLDRHRVISNASCTTNCMAPVVQVLDEALGVERGLLTTVHSYTRGQELLDGPSKEARYGRSAAFNMVPAATGAARAVGRVLPHLAGRLDATAVRVPTPNVSMVQLVIELRRSTTLADLRELFRAAASGRLESILAVTEEELVSSDFLGDPHSAVVDLPLLQIIDGTLLRVVAWYDNEWGYAHRLADLLERLAGPTEGGS